MSASHPAPSKGDRNLLFGILALQMDFISKDALVQAMNAWVLDKARPLGQILVEQGALAADNQVLLDTLVERHLALHHHDPAQSLAALPSAGSVRDDLERIADADLDASLSLCPVTPPLGEGTAATGASMGTPTSAGLRFRIVRPHAEGGLSEVFVAVDEELRREVALKEIQHLYADDAESRTRFVREAEITGNLEHPGVVPVYGLGQYTDGRPFYAMRFIRGQSLQTAIDRFHKSEKAGRAAGEHTLQLRQLLGRFVAVCNTMAYVNSRGVIHGDLKPANVMLGPYGETLVVDWGLAKLIAQPEATGSAEEPGLATAASNDSDLTQAGRALGTPAYMSPEQAAGQLDLLGPASDVYSLGATLYCLLTGNAPSSSTDPGQMLAKVRIGKFPPPRQRNAQVPAALEAICLKAMALKPEERNGTAKALGDDLEHWLADEPVTACVEPWQARLGRWVRHHKGLVGSVAAACVLAVTIGVACGLVATAKAHETEEQSLRFEADEQRALVRRLLYFSRINMAERAWENNQMDRMEDILVEYQQPQPSQEDLRGFEWNYLWRLRHSYLLNLQGGTSPVWSVAFSSDGHHLAGAAGVPKKLGEVKVWDAETGQEVLSFKGHTGIVFSVAFSPDGRRVASASEDMTVKVWDATTGRETLTLKHPAGVHNLAFSPDGVRLASAAVHIGKSGEIKVWEVATGQQALSWKGHTDSVLSMAFSPDGLRLASSSYDRTVKVWDATSGQEVLSFHGHSRSVNSVAFSPDSRRLAGASEDKTVKIWDATTGQEVISLHGHTDEVNSVAFSPDGHRIASASGDPNISDKAGKVKVWDATTGQEALSFIGHAGVVLSVAFSPDGRRLASSGRDGVKVWDATTGQAILSLKGHTNTVLSVAFSPDGRTLASGSADMTIKVWSATTGQEIFTLKGHNHQVQSVAFTPDGHCLASGSMDNTAKVWEADPLNSDVILQRQAAFLVASLYLARIAHRAILSTAVIDYMTPPIAVGLSETLAEVASPPTQLAPPPVFRPRRAPRTPQRPGCVAEWGFPYMGRSAPTQGSDGRPSNTWPTNAVTAWWTCSHRRRPGQVSDTCNQIRRALLTTTAPTFHSR